MLLLRKYTTIIKRFKNFFFFFKNLTLLFSMDALNLYKL